MTEISTIIRARLDEGRAIADEDVRALLNENEKVREALYQIRDQEPNRQAWSVGVARKTLGEKE